jgi:hypothetical protein
MSDNQFEVIEDAEEENRQIEEVANLMRQLLQKRYAESGNFLRGVHPKSHGCLKAKFEILKDINEDLKVGLFGNAGDSYDAFVRFSNADSLVRHDLRDGENGSRGMAIKIMQVPGDVLNEDSGQSSQDFLMINTPQFAFANIPDYLKLQQVLLQFDDSPAAFFAPLQSPPPSDPAELAAFMRVKQSFDVVSLIKTIPVANPLEVSYFGAAPFLFGKDRVMRVSVAPRVQPVQAVPDDAGENYLREAIVATMEKSEDVVFDFKIQVRNAGEDNLHIEDATQFWKTEDFPPETVARLTIPAPQTGELDCTQRFFTPWHSLAAHQPLGGINRLRKAAYIASAKRRQAIQSESSC